MAVKANYTITIILDKRRQLKNGTYPVRLRVFTLKPKKKHKIYPTEYAMTEKQFEEAWMVEKPKQSFRQIRAELKDLETKAFRNAAKLKPFTYEQFEKMMDDKSFVDLSVRKYYHEMVEELNQRKRLGTASSYSLSWNSIEKFVSKELKADPNYLMFTDITDVWLKDYETYMVKNKKSLTTVGVYLRALRALFNLAIDKKELEPQHYPFGKRKFQIPATKNVKKALSKDQLKALFEANLERDEQKKARAFWFFSYACNGMNVKDIALLRYSDIENDKITFVRAKTQLTTKANQKPITVYLNEFSHEVIETYGIPMKKKDDFIFDVVTKNMTPEEQRVKIQNFTRFINQHMENICKSLELPKISTYWARHSFATNAIRSGATMEFIQESLGHKDLATTQNYFAGFDSDTKKQFAKTIMNFD